MPNTVGRNSIVYTEYTQKCKSLPQKYIMHDLHLMINTLEKNKAHGGIINDSWEEGSGLVVCLMAASENRYNIWGLFGGGESNKWQQSKENIIQSKEIARLQF